MQNGILLGAAVAAVGALGNAVLAKPNFQWAVSWVVPAVAEMQ